METPTMRHLPALGKMQQAGIPVNSCDFPGSPAAETLCVQSRGPGLIPSQGTRSHMPQLRVHMPPLKILYAVMKIEDPGCCN